MTRGVSGDRPGSCPRPDVRGSALQARWSWRRRSCPRGLQRLPGFSTLSCGDPVPWGHVACVPEMLGHWRPSRTRAAARAAPTHPRGASGGLPQSSQPLSGAWGFTAPISAWTAGSRARRALPLSRLPVRTRVSTPPRPTGGPWRGPWLLGLFREGGGGPRTAVPDHQTEDVRSAQTVDGSLHLHSFPATVSSSRPHLRPAATSAGRPQSVTAPRSLSFLASTSPKGAVSAAGLRPESPRGRGETVPEPRAKHHCDSATSAVTEPSVAPCVIQGRSPPVTSPVRPYNLHFIQKTKEGCQRTEVGTVTDTRWLWMSRS